MQEIFPATEQSFSLAPIVIIIPRLYMWLVITYNYKRRKQCFHNWGFHFNFRQNHFKAIRGEIELEEKDNII